MGNKEKFKLLIDIIMTLIEVMKIHYSCNIKHINKRYYTTFRKTHITIILLKRMCRHCTKWI